MSPVPGSSAKTTNYLIPSSGGTQAVPVIGIFSAQPEVIDWRQYANDIDGPFSPQGVYIDNTAGTGTLTVNVYAGGNASALGTPFWTVTCVAGARTTENFPAPEGQIVSITGNGQATVIFVNYPVLPEANSVTVQGGTVGISGQPIATTPAVNAAGAPYQVQEIPVTSAVQFNNAITGGTTSSGNIAPGAANQYLRKLTLRLTGNVSLAAAGLNAITATLNGTQIWKGSVYIPAAAPNVAEYWREELDFTSGSIGLNYGAGGLVVTVGTALATGSLEINAYTG